jgi:DNA-binding NarL/FixJ family response regulator
MVGPLPAGRKWTSDEEKHLVDLLVSGAKAPAIARRLKRSTGAIYARINDLRKASAPRSSLPSERLIAAHALASKEQRAR